MTKYLENFKRFKPLLLELVTRDIKTKYRRSILGVLWTLLNPLLMMIVLSIVFSHLFRFQVENYPLYLLSGQLIFNFFSEATSSAMSSVINNAPLIKKVYIPKYLFPLARISSSVINLMASFCALILVMVFTKAELHYTLFLSVVPLVFLLCFVTGIGMILATIAVKFRDILHLYGVFITAYTYLTPVIYPIDMLSGPVRTLVSLNPMTVIVTMFRDLIIYNQLPSVWSVIGAAVVSVVVLALGFYVFYKKQDEFILNI